MSSRRVQKIAAAVREVVSMAILTQLKDPRVRDVTVTRVEVSGDLRQAKIHVSIMGSDVRQELAMRGLASAAGFLQSKVAQRIETRYTPRLEFVLDLGVKKSIEISRILREVLPSSAADDPAGAPEPYESPADGERPDGHGSAGHEGAVDDSSVHEAAVREGAAHEAAVHEGAVHEGASRSGERQDGA